MGLLRLFIIMLSFAVMSEAPTDDGTSYFRSVIVFYTMLLLDYFRIANNEMKWRSIKEYIKRYGFWVGTVGVLTSLAFTGIATLGAFKELVIVKVGSTESTEYFITNSKTFLLFTTNLSLVSFIHVSGVVTLFVSIFELFVPKGQMKKKDKDTSKEQSVPSKVTEEIVQGHATAASALAQPQPQSSK